MARQGCAYGGLPPPPQGRQVCGRDDPALPPVPAPPPPFSGSRTLPLLLLPLSGAGTLPPLSLSVAHPTPFPSLPLTLPLASLSTSPPYPSTLHPFNSLSTLIPVRHGSAARPQEASPRWRGCWRYRPRLRCPLRGMRARLHPPRTIQPTPAAAEGWRRRRRRRRRTARWGRRGATICTAGAERARRRGEWWRGALLREGARAACG